MASGKQLGEIREIEWRSQGCLEGWDSSLDLPLGDQTSRTNSKENVATLPYSTAIAAAIKLVSPRSVIIIETIAPE